MYLWKCGCLDAFASEMAMNNEYKKLCLEAGKEYSKDEEHLTVQDFIEKAEKGEEMSRQVLKRSGFYIGIAIANLIKTLEITTVIIGGLYRLKIPNLLMKLKYGKELSDKRI